VPCRGGGHLPSNTSGATGPDSTHDTHGMRRSGSMCQAQRSHRVHSACRRPVPHDPRRTHGHITVWGRPTARRPHSRQHHRASYSSRASGRKFGSPRLKTGRPQVGAPAPTRCGQTQPAAASNWQLGGGLLPPPKCKRALATSLRLVADAEKQLGAAVDGVLFGIVRMLLRRNLQDRWRLAFEGIDGVADLRGNVLVDQHDRHV
jgi:hypothetical protein